MKLHFLIDSQLKVPKITETITELLHSSKPNNLTHMFSFPEWIIRFVILFNIIVNACEKVLPFYFFSERF